MASSKGSVTVFFAAMFLIGGALSQSNCPTGWYGFGDSCYLFQPRTLTVRGLSWEDARRECLNYGGDLVSVANKSEMDFIYNQLIQHGKSEFYWIGLNDRRNESVFVWSDGTPFNGSVYNNWRRGEPNNRTGEDCAELHGSAWNDNGCKKEFGYICERPRAPVFGSQLSNQTVVEGGRAVFRCHVSGNPEPNVMWYRNGKPIRNSGSFTVVSKRLRIHPVKLTHEGAYSCVANNSKGTELVQVFLTVTAGKSENESLSLTWAVVIIVVVLLVALPPAVYIVKKLFSHFTQVDQNVREDIGGEPTTERTGFIQENSAPSFDASAVLSRQLCNAEPLGAGATGENSSVRFQTGDLVIYNNRVTAVNLNTLNTNINTTNNYNVELEQNGGMTVVGDNANINNYDQPPQY